MDAEVKAEMFDHIRAALREDPGATAKAVLASVRETMGGALPCAESSFLGVYVGEVRKELGIRPGSGPRSVSEKKTAKKKAPTPRAEAPSPPPPDDAAPAPPAAEAEGAGGAEQEEPPPLEEIPDRLEQIELEAAPVIIAGPGVAFDATPRGDLWHVRLTIETDEETMRDLAGHAVLTAFPGLLPTP